jgi:hypothetical protein
MAAPTTKSKAVSRYACHLTPNREQFRMQRFFSAINGE